MSEPTTPLYPTAYDSAASILGEPRNRRIAQLAAPVSIDSLVIVTDGDLTDLELPTYVIFEGGEIVYAESIGGTSNERLILQSLTQRGVLSSRIQPHGVGEALYFGLTSRHYTLLKAAIIAAEKYHAVVGLDSAKSATPDPGWAYFAYDVGKLYICFVDNSWVWVNRMQHNDLDGRADDDHTQYHIDSRAVTWHDGLTGDHIVDGDNHNHVVHGGAVHAIASGLNANRPSPSAGRVYIATDLDGGTLWVAVDDSNWAKISGVPTGGIAMFDQDCPTGWSRYTEMDNGKYALPSTVAEAGTTGGSTTHTHVYDGLPKHYHRIPASSEMTSTTVDPHTHTIDVRGGSGVTNRMRMGNTSGTQWTSTYTGHSHTLTKYQHNTQPTGSSANTVATNSLPASREVVFCKKG